MGRRSGAQLPFPKHYLTKRGSNDCISIRRYYDVWWYDLTADNIILWLRSLPAEISLKILNIRVAT